MSKTLNISDEDRALLTEEEIAGMMEGESFDEGQEEGAGDDAAGAAVETPAAAPADDAAAQAAAKAEADAAAAAAAAAQPGDDGAAAGRDDGAPEHSAPVSFDTVLPEDFEEQVQKISTDKAALITQFDEGDITNAEYHQKLDDLNRKERELERISDRAEYDLRQRRQTWVNVTVAGFMADHPEYKTPMLQGLLDIEVRKLQASGDYSSDTDPKILVDAHEQIAAQLPGAFTAQAAKPGTEKPAAPAKKPTVPTLANVPAANIDQPGSGEFDMLDRLQDSDPLRYERELEKLARTNPAKYEEYLAS